MSDDQVRRARALFESGAQALRAARYDAARERLSAAVELFTALVLVGSRELEPELASSWNDLGIVHRDQGALAAAADAQPALAWTSRLGTTVRQLVSDAEAAIAAETYGALSETERRRILGEQLLQAALGDLWPSVHARIAALARDDAESDETVLQRIAEIEKDLLDTREIRQDEPRWRHALSQLLGADARRVLGSRVFDHLLVALAAPSALEKVGAPPEATAAVALHQLGAAVEAALEARVFGPYRTAIQNGVADPIVDAGPLQQYLAGGSESNLRLGTITTPWGRLGAHWREPRPSIAALAEWLVGDDGSFDRDRVRDPLLYRLGNDEGPLLDRIAALRNRGAHGTGSLANTNDATELERLVLGVWQAGGERQSGFLPRLFGALRRSA